MGGGTMEFGVMLSSFGDHASPAAFRRVATAAEDAGFDAVWAGDHLTFPEQIPDEYPFSPDGTPPPGFTAQANAFEVFCVLSHLAGITDEVDLGTNVTIVPYRHPVVLAKLALTLEAVSGGRFDFGVGVGWMRTEFEVLDVPFSERGSRTDEFLAMFERACSEGVIAFDGPHHTFQETGFHPVPVEPPRIWVGGTSRAAFRRIAEYGDGWSIVWHRPDAVARDRDRLLTAWSEYDRVGEPEIAVMRPVHVGAETDLDTSRPLIGEAESVVADLEAYAAAGVTRVILDFFTRDIDEQLTQLHRISDRVATEL